MLVLSGKVGEVVHIDGPAEVKLLDVRGQRVRYGVTADRSVNVTRQNAKNKSPQPKRVSQETAVA